MKHRLKDWLLPVFLLCSFFSAFSQQPPEVEAEGQPPAEDVRQAFVGINFKFFNYESFSPTKTSFPLRGGYPSFQSVHPAGDISLHLLLRRFSHHFEFTALLPARLSSNNGLGQELLLTSTGSSFQRYQLNYHFLTRILQLGGARLSAGMGAAGLFEQRELSFISGRFEKRYDMGLGLGPSFAFQIPFGEKVLLNTEGQVLVFLPWLGAGRWEVKNAGDLTLNSYYYPLVGASTLGANIMWPATGSFRMLFGFRRNHQIGYSSASPSLHDSELVTSKFDRLNEFYLGFVIKTGGKQ